MQPRRQPLPEHPSELIYIKNRPFFPISWLQKQDYCEYQIYLENIKGIKARPTISMTRGAQKHEQLYAQFAEKAVPATIEDMLVESKKANLYSREFRVVDIEHGIYGLIDEVWFSPDGFTVIDDKPGIRAYSSSIHQVYGYCLAYKSSVLRNDTRPVTGALRERGTSHVFWQSPFNQEAMKEIVPLVNHIHALLAGKEQFSSTDNRNKCRACRFSSQCDRNLK